MSSKLSSNSHGVKHHLPTRTRLKVSRKFRHEHRLEEIGRALRRVPSVNEVDINLKTGSILVHHKNDPEILQKLESAIESVASDVVTELVRVSLAEEEDVSLLAEIIGKTMRRANRGLSKYTGNQVDLRMAIPIMFLLLGIDKASRTPGWFSHAPAYVFFYWAYDAYVRFHLHRFEERMENGHATMILN